MSRRWSALVRGSHRVVCTSCVPGPGRETSRGGSGPRSAHRGGEGEGGVEGGGGGGRRGGGGGEEGGKKERGDVLCRLCALAVDTVLYQWLSLPQRWTAEEEMEDQNVERLPGLTILNTVAVVMLRY